MDVEIHEWLSKKGISINGDDVNESLLLINTIGLICEPTRLMVETIKYIESKGEDRKNDKNTLARNARRN
ncbi:MAG: hypothetical protein IJZ29_04270 [Clostridia bacterium]|nr:hypothetical protein [Clostridia bacterium]